MWFKSLFGKIGGNAYTVYHGKGKGNSIPWKGKGKGNGYLEMNFGICRYMFYESLSRMRSKLYSSPSVIMNLQFYSCPAQRENMKIESFFVY